MLAWLDVPPKDGGRWIHDGGMVTVMARYLRAQLTPGAQI